MSVDIFFYILVVFTLIYFASQLLTKRINYHSKPLVLITGANSGLGRELALFFSKQGWRIILAGRNKEKIEEVALDISSWGTPCESTVIIDLLSKNSIEDGATQILTKFGAPDIIVNNAGVGHRGSCEETSLEVLKKIMKTNFFGPVYLTKLFLPHMIKKQTGHIVNIITVQAFLSVINRSAYASSKAALASYMDCLRTEVEDHGISVTNIYPGYIHTAFSLNALTSTGDRHEKMDQSTQSGLDPSVVAQQIYTIIQGKDKETIIASPKIRLAILLRHIFPSFIFFMTRPKN